MTRYYAKPRGWFDEGEFREHPLPEPDLPLVIEDMGPRQTGLFDAEGRELVADDRAEFVGFDLRRRER